MQMMIEATEMITTFDGVQCRLWKGTTAGGVDCHVFIHRIGVANGLDHAEFDRELLEQLPPGQLVPLSMIL